MKTGILLIITILTVILLFTMTSCLPEQPVTEATLRKKAVVCKDSVRIVWDETKLVETSWLTGNPCFDHGGIAYYVYK